MKKLGYQEVEDVLKIFILTSASEQMIQQISAWVLFQLVYAHSSPFSVLKLYTFCFKRLSPSLPYSIIPLLSCLLPTLWKGTFSQFPIFSLSVQSFHTCKKKKLSKFQLWKSICLYLLFISNFSYYRKLKNFKWST